MVAIWAAAGTALIPFLMTVPSPVFEVRYCHAISEIPRYADGTIKRSTTVRNQFVAHNPCPVTGAITGACPGWEVDHVIPLACGGCDAVYNMQWLPVAIKRCSDKPCKDRWERTLYCPNNPIGR